MDTSASLSAGFTHTPPRGWAVALLSRLQVSSSALISYTFGIFLPFIGNDLDLSPLEVGMLQGVWWITTALLALPCSVWLSRFRPVPLILVSLLLQTPFLFSQGLATGFRTLLLTRFLFVCFQVLAAPARPLILQQWVAPGQYATVNAVGLSQHSIILALTISTSAWMIIAVGSWRLAYVIHGGFFVLQTIAWLIVAREGKAPVQGMQRALEAQQPTPLKALVAYPQSWFLGITMLALSMTWTALVTFLPTLLMQQDGMPPSLSGPLLGFLYYALIPSSLLAGRLAKKVPNRKLLLWIPALCNVVLGLLTTLTFSPWLLAVLLTGIGIVWIVSPIMEALPFEYPGIRPREVAVIASLIRTLMGLGFALGPMVTGLVAEMTGSLQLGLQVLCLLTGIGVVSGLLYPSLAKTRTED
ncbi:MAG: MFS transporter [Candidatus Tectomicrobia bacterium]